MTAAILPFRTSAGDAWKAYITLEREALTDPNLRLDMDHTRRRSTAHERWMRIAEAAQ